MRSALHALQWQLRKAQHYVRVIREIQNRHLRYPESRNLGKLEGNQKLNKQLKIFYFFPYRLWTALQEETEDRTNYNLYLTSLWRNALLTCLNLLRCSTNICGADQSMSLLTPCCFLSQVGQCHASQLLSCSALEWSWKAAVKRNNPHNHSKNATYVDAINEIFCAANAIAIKDRANMIIVIIINPNLPSVPNMTYWANILISI